MPAHISRSADGNPKPGTAMETSAAYVKAAKQVIPLAENKIVRDRFHVMQMVTKALDNVRRGEPRQMMKVGDECLSKTKHIWLTSFENLSDRHSVLFDATYDLQLQIGTVRAYKEMRCDHWPPTSAAAAPQVMSMTRASDSNKTQADEDRRKIKQGTSGEYSDYCTHRIKNGVADGTNNRIVSTKQRVSGSRNRQDSKAAIFF